jgi:hypothetical protein
MTANTCFYCGKPSTKVALIERLYGLKCCDDHIAAGQRDCNAQLHEDKIIRLDDALNHEIIGRFLKILMSLKSGFPILRSSGEIQNGWTVHELGWEGTFLRWYEGDWRLHVLWKSPDGNFNNDKLKYVPIIHFKMRDIYQRIKDQIPEDFLSLIDQAIFCMIDGIYSKDFEAIQGLEVEEYPELNNVHNILYDGDIARIMIPSGPSGPSNTSVLVDDDNPA